MNEKHPPAVRLPALVAAALAVMGAALLLAMPVSREVLRTTAPHTALDVERFGGKRTLGQTFLAPEDRLSELHLSVQPPIPREVFPLFFHLRHGRYASTDVRTVVITAADSDAQGTIRARFLPVEKSGGRPYAFLLEAPRATSRQLAAYRQIDGSIYDRGFVFFGETSDVRPGDLEFTAVVRQPRLLAFWNTRLRSLLTQTLRGRDLPRALGIGSLTTAAFLLLLTRLPRTTPTQRAILLSVLVVAHIALHAPFLLSYPSVNDEGSYLMDIQNIRAGYWPFRDTLAKGPLFLALLAPVALFLPHTLLPARLLVAGLSATEVVLLYVLGRKLSGQTAGFLAATLWALSPIAVAQTSQLVLQPFSLPLVTLALILALPANEKSATNGKERRALLTEKRTVILVGILLALAYLVRASSVAFVVPAILLRFTHRGFRAGIRDAVRLLGGLTITLALVALPTLIALGPQRTAVMFNAEAFVIGQARAGSPNAIGTFHILPPREILERFTAYGAVLFRLGIPLVLLWLAAVSSTLTVFLRLPAVFSGIWFLGISLPLLQRVYKTNFTLAGDLADVGPSLKLLAAGVTVLIPIALWWLPRAFRPPARQSAREFLLLGGTWVSLALVYAFFGRFRQQYHLEFLPLYVLGAALFLASLLLQGAPEESGHSLVRRRLRGLVGILLTVALTAFLFLSFLPSRAQPHAGSLSHQTALDVARIVREHSSPGEEILTAQGLFTFTADRALPFGASHPGWYLEERVGTVPTALRRLFLPDKDTLRRAMREKPIRLVVIDRRTREVYFSYDPEMRDLLAREYRLLETVPNPLEEHPVEIWMRVTDRH